MSGNKSQLSPSQIDTVNDICNSFNNDSNELINILHKIQNTLNHIPDKVQKIISEKLNLPKSKITETVNHYSFFFTVPKGKYHISVCIENDCLEKGGEAILNEFKKELKIDPGESTPDGIFSLSTLKCMGTCGLAPVVMIGDKIIYKVKVSEVKSIIEEFRNQ